MHASGAAITRDVRLVSSPPTAVETRSFQGFLSDTAAAKNVQTISTVCSREYQLRNGI